MSESEQNKTEEATPFKLRKAREKGQVAKGNDLGFFANLIAICIFSVLAGTTLINQTVNLVQVTLLNAGTTASGPNAITNIISKLYWPTIQSLSLLGGTIVLTVVFFEILQLRGIIFSTHPLKPDFSRVNPGKGLKRVFSLKTLKEALKNIFKMVVYIVAAALITIYCVRLYDNTMMDGQGVITALTGSSYRLLFTFAALAVIFVILDQIISRQEFRKQMRMSKSELQRENKDREGEPRQKQKRKQLHAEFTKQAQNLGDLPGSDMLIVNPQHFAVGLAYDPATMTAPQLTAKGRNKFALFLKSEARRLAIPIIENPPLARQIFRQTQKGHEVSAEHFVALAAIYIQLRQSKEGTGEEHSND